jgi:hypothetical protein
MQLALVLVLSLLAAMSLAGVVILEMNGRNNVGVLSAVAGACVVALAGLMKSWSDGLKPLTAQVTQIQNDLHSNTATTNKIASDVNGHNTALTQKIADLESRLVSEGTASGRKNDCASSTLPPPGKVE